MRILPDDLKYNEDNIDKAVEGLSQFCHSFCINVKETNKQQDLIFRCEECCFREENGICKVKVFLNSHTDFEHYIQCTSMGIPSI